MRNNIPLVHVFISLTLSFLDLLRRFLLLTPRIRINTLLYDIEHIGSKKNLLVHVLILLTLSFLVLLHRLLPFPARNGTVDNVGDAGNAEARVLGESFVALQIGGKKQQHSARTLF
jgi:hypothetical protein